MKKICAKEALKYIKDGMIIGLGGGSTVGYLAEFLAKEQRDVKVVTPSTQTEEMCVELGLSLVPLAWADHIDVAFDGCDELDENLNALKSNGAIHTREKIVAAMAKQYILLIDEEKYFTKMPFEHSVTLEVIPESRRYVEKQIALLSGTSDVRKCTQKAGYTISDNGNLIMDTYFPEGTDPKELHHKLKGITGVVETALFVDQVTFALCVCKSGIRIIK